MKLIRVRLSILAGLVLISGSSPAQAWTSTDIAFQQVAGTSTDSANATVVDSSGNIYITGTFTGTVDFDPSSETNSLSSPGMNNGYVLKLDSRGSFIWVKHLSGSYAVTGNAIKLDSSGNIYVTGDFQNLVDFDPGSGVAELTSSGSNDGFIVKLTSSGEYLWAAKFGNTGDDRGNSVAVGSSDSVYISGRFSGTADFDPSANVETMTASGNDNYLVKLSSDGIFTWVKKFGGTGGEYFAYVATTSDYVYITGSFQLTADFDPGVGTFSMTSAGNPDIYLAKLNSAGEFQWAKRIGAGNAEFSRSITLDAQGNVLVAGIFQLSPDFDPGSETVTVSAIGGQDVFLLKLDSSGSYVWSRQFGGTDIDEADGITTDSDSNIYFTGHFASSTDINPGIDTETLTSAGSYDISILKLNSVGEYQWSYRIGGTGDDRGTAVAVGGSDAIDFVGTFQSTVDFNPTSGTSSITSAGGTDGFFLRFYKSGAIYPAYIAIQKTADQLSKEAREAHEKAVREAQDVVKNELARGGVITVEQFAAADLRGVTVKNVDLINSEISKLPKSESGVISAVAKIVFKYEVAGRVEGKGTIFYSELAAAGLAPESSSYKTMIVRDLKKLSGSDLSTIAQIQSAIQVIEAKYKERKAKLSAVVERIATRSVK